MGTGYLSMITFSVSSLIGLMLQATELPIGIVTQLERVGIVGGSLAAVWTLWRALGKKDDHTLTLTKAVSEAMVASTDAQRELRAIIADTTKAQTELRVAIERLVDVVAGCPAHDEVFKKVK
jgi:hypothetical protein